MRWTSLDVICENEDLYHQRDDLSQSKIKDFLSSPELFCARHVAKTDKFEPKSCLEFGKEVHESVLLRGMIGGFQVIPSEVLSSDGKKAGNKWKEFQKANEGKLLLKLSEAEAFDRVIDSLMSHPVACEMMRQTETSASELTLRSIVTVGTDGLQATVKSRIDRMTAPGEIWDLKTTGDLDRMKWVVRDFGWDVQAYVYGAAADAHFGVTGSEVTFVVVETKVPYRVRLWRASPATLDGAADKVGMALADILARKASGDWNAYDWCALNLF